jgi:hypothetical protein
MNTRVRLFAILRLATVAAALAGCGGTRGKLIVDTPATPYQKPDISEITGIEEPDDDGEGSAATPAETKK